MFLFFNCCFEIKIVFGKDYMSDDTAIFSTGNDNETMTGEYPGKERQIYCLQVEKRRKAIAFPLLSHEGSFCISCIISGWRHSLLDCIRLPKLCIMRLIEHFRNNWRRRNEYCCLGTLNYVLSPWWSISTGHSYPQPTFSPTSFKASDIKI